MPDDLRSKDVRQGFSKSIDEIQRRFPDGESLVSATSKLTRAGIPLLDPVEDMKIKSEEMTKTIQRTAILEERLKGHALHADADLESLMALASRKEEVSFRDMNSVQCPYDTTR
jgi:ATP-dependent RNA helicase DOB1